MNASGILIVGVGVLVLSQVLFGDALTRVGLVKAAA